jgi:hypothetical protein
MSSCCRRSRTCRNGVLLHQPNAAYLPPSTPMWGSRNAYRDAASPPPLSPPPSCRTMLRQPRRKVADQPRPELPRLAAAMDEAETMCWPIWTSPPHTAPSFTRPIRWNGSTARSSVAPMSSALSPNEEAIYRLVGAILLEQNDEWSVQRARYMTLETIATLSDGATVSLPASAV